MRGAKVAGPLLLVALVAAAALAGASVAYESASGAHAGAALSASVLGTDSLGAALALLLAAQLALAYGFAPIARRQVAVHSALAWPIAAVVALHGLGGAWHAVQAPRESVPLALVAIGVVVVALLVWQIVEGRFRRSHVAGHAVLGLTLGAVVLAHVVLGTVHAITG